MGFLNSIHNIPWHSFEICMKRLNSLIRQSQRRSENARKGKLLDQAGILSNCIPFQNWNFSSRHKKLSNKNGTTHYDSLQVSYWADQKDSHNEVVMTSLQGQ